MGSIVKKLIVVQSVTAEETHQNMGQNFILGHLLSRYPIRSYDDLAGLGAKATIPNYIILVKFYENPIIPAVH